MIRFGFLARARSARCLTYVGSLLLSVALVGIPTPPAAHAASCQFVLGFAAIHDLIPQTVGQCLEDEHHNAINGDGLQASVGGLLVWRKADNWSAFTDGYRTWVNGPSGLQQRLNSQRFSWEANPDGLPIVGGATITRCDSPDLTVGLGRVDAGAGNLNESITFTNTSSRTCDLYGFPGLQMYDAQNQPLPTKVTWGQGAQQPGPSDVVLGPGAVASFNLHWEHIPVGNETTCPTSDHVAITPPDAFTSITVPLHLDACGGGQLDVSAVTAGPGPNVG
jgi:hypothetical protein